MSVAVVYRRQVGRDLAAGYHYYEAQAPQLGEKFLAAITALCNGISEYPRMFAEVHGDVRRAVLSDFPYAVFYRVESRRVVVLTVLHTARDPKLWPSP